MCLGVYLDRSGNKTVTSIMICSGGKRDKKINCAMCGAHCINKCLMYTLVASFGSGREERGKAL